MLEDPFADDVPQAEGRVLGTLKALAVVLMLIALVVGAVALSRYAYAESFGMEDEAGNKIQLLDEPCYDAPPLAGLA